jgi:hypothetical protein
LEEDWMMSEEKKTEGQHGEQGGTPVSLASDSTQEKETSRDALFFTNSCRSYYQFRTIDETMPR